MLDITPKQAQVLDHKGLSLLIIAPAGCGKTETLALRVRGLLDQQAVRASQRILVATFTKRARDNMHDRLSHYLTPREMREAVTVCNFHGLFARIIQAHSNVIGLDPKRLTMPEHDWVGERCRALKLKGLTNDVKSDISSAKRRALNDEQVLAELQGSGNQYAFMIEEQRQAESRLTYDDLPRLAELILANDEVAALYRQHFGAIIVDEFQDLTPQQLRVVQRIGYKKTTYAGDLAQGIYAFAGAQPEYVKKELETECSETIEFAESFRSSPAVLTAVNSLNSLTGGQVLTAAAPDSWPSGGLAAYRQFNRAQEEAKYIKNLCSWILSEGQAPQQRIGISARLNKRRRQLVDEVIAASGLPYCIWDDGVLDKSIAQKIRSMLRGLSLSEFHSADDPLAFLRQAVAFDNEQDPDERTALSSAVDWCLDLLQKDLNPDTIQKRIQIGDNDSLITRAGIHLLTGHAGKGQQFDWMVVVGLEEDYLPSYQAIQAGDNSAMMDEEARTLAVMLSRARHGVLVTSSSVIPGDFIPNKRQSRFLTNLLPAVISDRQQIHDWLTEADWKAIAER